MASGADQGRPITAGVLPTTGASIEIKGTNFGLSSFKNYRLSFLSEVNLFNQILTSKNVLGNSSPSPSLCSVHDHSQMICALPPGQGNGYELELSVHGQTPTRGRWDGINYAPPSVDSVKPTKINTFNPGTITIEGVNFGASLPSVHILGTGKNCTVVTHTQTQILCRVESGQGRRHKVLVTAGGQSSSDDAGVATVSFVAPTITNFEPKTGRTDGMKEGTTSDPPTEQDRKTMTIEGANFGTPENTNFQVIFVATSETTDANGNPTTFVVPASDIISRTHEKVLLFQPQGYGANVKIQIQSGDQESVLSELAFTYEAPTVTRMQPRCETYDRDKPLNQIVQCFGYSVPGFLRVQDYPKIISIVVGSDGSSLVQLQWVTGTTPFLIEVGDTLRIAGMRGAKGVGTNALQNFDGDWSVTRVPEDFADTKTKFYFKSNERKNIVGIPMPDTYMGWNNPTGNLRALVSKSYQSARSLSFKTLETDGCSTRDLDGVRESAWENIGSYESRLRKLDATDPKLAAESARQCEAPQKIVITGSGFGASSLATPIFVTMRRKECDCTVSLSGLSAPCMHPIKKLCQGYIETGGVCPKGYDDCSKVDDNSDQSYAMVLPDLEKKCPSRLLEKYGDPLCRYYKELEIVNHDHAEIVVVSTAGYGRRHQMNVQVGKRWSSVSAANEKERYMRYLPPAVTGFEVHSRSGVQIYRPDGTTRIAVLGNNLGYGSAGNVTSLIEVRIGTDYDVNGNYCGNDDRCMKICGDAQWHAEKRDGGKDLQGFPYIDCIIPEDTAGFKNISLRLAGQVDDCRTNQILCGLPLSFPSDRRVVPQEIRDDNISAIANSGAYTGLVFTCSKAGQTEQSYARPGERCEDDINAECADADCTAPKSNPGFWRLDLDLSFACSSDSGSIGGGTPCQTDITGKIESTGILSSLNPFYQDPSGDQSAGSSLSLESICHAGTITLDNEGNNQSSCGEESASGASDASNGFRQCDVRAGNSPGTCLFRRPKEARRAMGEMFWPWSCPGKDLGANQPTMAYSGTEEGDADELAARKECRLSNSEAYDYVLSLRNATCPERRVSQLVNYSVYEQYPSLVISDVCYGIVACSPKESCLGNNQCNEGYEYNKFRCLAWNTKNPDRLNCTSDDQCRQRSGQATEGESGLSSACDPRHPEDCSRCVVENNADVGTCECVGGGPRCGLCRQSIAKEDSHDGREYKGENVIVIVGFVLHTFFDFSFLSPSSQVTFD